MSLQNLTQTATWQVKGDGRPVTMKTLVAHSFGNQVKPSCSPNGGQLLFEDEKAVTRHTDEAVIHKKTTMCSRRSAR